MDTPLSASGSRPPTPPVISNRLIKDSKSPSQADSEKKNLRALKKGSDLPVPTTEGRDHVTDLTRMFVSNSADTDQEVGTSSSIELSSVAVEGDERGVDSKGKENEVKIDPLERIADQVVDLANIFVVTRPGKGLGFDAAASEAKSLRHVGDSIGKAGRLAATQVTREFLVERYGATEAQFNNFLSQTGSIFSKSASAGQSLASVNDHAGVLIVSAWDGKGDQNGPDRRIAERLVVVTDITSKGETRYLIKGYGGHIVQFEDFQQSLKELQDIKTAKSIARGRMETRFRSALLDLSKTSELVARRDLKESDTAAFVPPAIENAGDRSKAFWDGFKAETWGNFEDAMPPGFGGEKPETKTGQVDFEFYFDKNSVENRIVLFRYDDFDKGNAGEGEDDVDKHKVKEGKERRGPIDGRVPSVKVDGTTLAQIDGIERVEVMGPAGKKHGGDLAALGTKMARTSPVNALFIQELTNPKRDVILRITTLDKAVHELHLTRTGAKMRLINPQHRLTHSSAGKAFGVYQQDDPFMAGVDVDVYSYRAGKYGSASGYPDPQLVTSCGDTIAPGPFLKPAGSTAGAMGGLLTAAGHLVTLQPLPGLRESSYIGGFVSKAVQVGALGAIVYGMTGVANRLRKGAYETIVAGTNAFSASGSGPLLPEMQATVLMATVAAQEGLQSAMNLVYRLLPEGSKTTDNTGQKFLWNWLGPAIAEFTRLSINFDIQRRLGVERGQGWADITSLGVLSGLTGFFSLSSAGSGYEENHPYLKTFSLTLRLLLETTARSMGSVGSIASPGYAMTDLTGVSSAEFDLTDDDFQSLFTEAFTTRLITRGPDKLLAGLVAHILDANGVLGPHASAYDHQISYEVRYGNAINRMLHLSDRLGLEAAKMEEHAKTWLEAQQIVQGLMSCFESIKPALNRAWLSCRSPKNKSDYYSQHDEDRAAVDNLGREQRTDRRPRVSFLDLEDGNVPSAHEDEQLERFEKTLAKAIKREAGRFVFESRSLSDEVRDDAVQIRETKQNSTTPYPTKVTYDGRVVYGDSLATTVKPMGRALSTFGSSGQRLAKPVTDAMRRIKGIEAVVDEQDLLPSVLHGIEQAVRAYTVESQLFHYPLRYPYTGQPRLVSVVPGVSLAYNVMHSAAGELVDPIGALYVNLGAARAPTFCNVVYRSVVTEAAYKPAGAPFVDSDLRGPSYVVNQGDIVGTTEEFSATVSKRMAASFMNPLGFGAAAKDRSQMMYIFQKTAVNITQWTDLVQAEVILTPGAVFTVRWVDETGGVDDQTQTGDDKRVPLGQIVYLKQVDTYEWEKNEHKRQEGDDVSAAELFMDEHGHLFKPTPGGDREFTSMKSYFVGSAMEWPKDKDKDPNTPLTHLARWLHPYTSDRAPRATKDAIHAAILTKDPIVKHLDEAIKNPHHEKFREWGGYYETNQSRSEAKAIAAVKETSKQIMAPIRGLELDGVMNSEETEWMAWLLTSMLREPVALVQVDVDSHGIASLAPDAEVRLFETTYDGVDIKLRIDRSPNRTVMIGVGADGYYVIESRVVNTQEGAKVAVTCHPIGNSAFTANNFLHAYYRSSSYSEPQAYSREGVILRPSGAADETVAKLFAEVQDFAGTDYIVLQRAIVGSRLGTAKYTANDVAALLHDPHLVNQLKKIPTDSDTHIAAVVAEEVRRNSDIAAIKLSLAQEKVWAAFKGATPAAEKKLDDMEMGVARNDGEGLNCLIVSLLQHVTGDYASQHKDMALILREGLLSQYPDAEGELYADDQHMQWLKHSIDQLYRTDLAVNVLVPNLEHGLAIHSRCGDGADEVDLLLGRGGLAHFEAITWAARARIIN